MFESIKATARKVKEGHEQAKAREREKAAERERKRTEREKLELTKLRESNKKAQLRLTRENKLREARKRRSQLRAEQFAQEPVVRGAKATAKATKGAARGLYRLTKKTTKEYRPGWVKRKGIDSLIGDFGEPAPRRKVLHYHQQRDRYGGTGWAYHTHADGEKRHQHSKFGLVGYSRYRPAPQRSDDGGRVIIVR